MRIKLEEERVFLRKLVDRALFDFNNEDSYLIKNGVSERSVVSRLSYHLQNLIKEIGNQLYKDYKVDVEYNRGSKGKDYLPKTNPDDNKYMVVDLVVHKRGTIDEIHRHGARELHLGYGNLICIEVKRTSASKNSIQKDLNRLKTMTDEDGGFFYSAGYMLLIDNKENILKIHKEFPENEG